MIGGDGDDARGAATWRRSVGGPIADTLTGGDGAERLRRRRGRRHAARRRRRRRARGRRGRRQPSPAGTAPTRVDAGDGDDAGRRRRLTAAGHRRACGPGDDAATVRPRRRACAADCERVVTRAGRPRSVPPRPAASRARRVPLPAPARPSCAGAAEPVRSQHERGGSVLRRCPRPRSARDRQRARRRQAARRRIARDRRCTIAARCAPRRRCACAARPRRAALPGPGSADGRPARSKLRLRETKARRRPARARRGHRARATDEARSTVIQARDGSASGRRSQRSEPRMAAPEAFVRAGRRRVRISNPDKVLFPADGITKADLAEYYVAVAPAMVPHVRDRPLNLWRWNAGIDSPSWSSRRSPRARRTGSGASVPRRQGRHGLPRGRRRDGDARLARQPELHHAARLDRAAPTAPTSPTGWSSTSTRPTRTRRPLRARSAPARSRSATLLRELGLAPHAMTSGSRGIHVVAPLRRGPDADRSAPAPGEIAEALAARRPDELTTEWRKVKREGRVLVDVARNTYGQTAVAPYAVRAPPRRAGGRAARVGGARRPGAAPAPLDARRRAGAARRARRPVGGIAPAARPLPSLGEIGTKADHLRRSASTRASRRLRSAVPVALAPVGALGLAFVARRAAPAGASSLARIEPPLVPQPRASAALGAAIKSRAGTASAASTPRNASTTRASNCASAPRSSSARAASAGSARR